MALALAWVQDKEGGLWGDTFETDSEKQIAGAIRNVRTIADRWLTTERTWAERGTDDDGHAYRVDLYLGAGKEIAKAFTFDLGETFNQDVFLLTVKKSAADVAQGAEDAAKKAKHLVDLLSTTKGKVLAAGAGLLLVGAVVAVARFTSPTRIVRA